MPVIEVDNIGPISHIEIPVPERGGMVVLKGKSGLGKSTAIAAIDALVSGDGRPAKRDGCGRAEVNGFGAKLTIQRGQKRSGVLEVAALEGRLSISDLIDPGIKDPVAADARRVKALVVLLGAEGGIERFRGVDPARFDQMVAESGVGDGDELLDIAAKLKRAFEAEARRFEEMTERAGAKASILRVELDSVLRSEPTITPDAAQMAVERAIQAQAAITERSRAAEQALGRAALGRRKLEALAKVPSISDADADVTKRTTELASAKDWFERARAAAKIAEEALVAARTAMTVAEVKEHEASGNLSAAVIARDNAQRTAAVLATLRSEIEAAEDVRAPGGAELAQAATSLAESRASLQESLQDATLRGKIPDLHLADFQARDWGQRAKELRGSASACDDRLAAIVSGPECPLRIEDGRVMIATSRGSTHYAELSSGERAAIALRIAIPRAGARGLICLDQRINQDLSPRTRQALAAQCRDAGVVLISAIVTDDEELTAEIVE